MVLSDSIGKGWSSSGVAMTEPVRARRLTDQEGQRLQQIVRRGSTGHVTAALPDRCFAFDQFGPLSIRPCHGTCWAKRKKPALLPATYHRTHGVRYFHGCYSLGADVTGGCPSGGAALR
jgi:hypothetical protein